MEEQLIKKNCKTGEYSNIFPITTINSVIDPDTGKSIKSIFDSMNHMYLPFAYNSKIMTRKQVPIKYRRKGLYITYVTFEGKIVTEYYINDVFDDESWSDDANWKVPDTGSGNVTQDVPIATNVTYGLVKGYSRQAIHNRDHSLFTASIGRNGAINIGINLATADEPGLMSKEDKSKLDNLNNSITPTEIPTVTTSVNGLMTKEDKFKLDNLNNYVLPNASLTTLGGIKASRAANIYGTEGAAYRADVDSNSAAVIHIEYATAEIPGLMTKEDKAKLDAISYSKILTKAEYNSLGTTDDNTVYFIKG